MHVNSWGVFSFPNSRILGLYRDNGLAITNATPRDAENIKKEICRIFNNNGLRITIEANKQIINFLDVTFDLNRSTYQPFTKPNTTIRSPREQPPSNHRKEHYQQTAVVPIIWLRILWPSSTSLPESTQWKRIPLHPEVRTSQNKQT